MLYVDLNCDVGESFGNYQLGADEALMKCMSSANIACGYHAGDPHVMQETVALAIKHNVAIGAHPGLPDLVGFGRRAMLISTAEAYQLTLYQVGALAAFVKAAAAKLHHVKPHGALYTMAAENIHLAEAIAMAVRDFDNSLILYGLAGSKLIDAGKNCGLKVANEVFGDRTYTNTAGLTPRSQPGAIIPDVTDAVKQVLHMIKKRKVLSTDNVEVAVHADTICLHGDNANALQFATAIREGVIAAGVIIKTFNG
jgi:5-oxoprolinase (ATP-hydrolysing) subunit A